MSTPPAADASETSAAGGEPTEQARPVQERNSLESRLKASAASARSAAEDDVAIFTPGADAPEMPEIRQSALDAASEKTSSTNSGEYAHVRDRFGTAFDPTLHENDGGVPRLTDGGRARRKRGGSANRPRASRLDAGGSGNPAPESAGTGNDQTAQYAGCAKALTGLTFALGQMVGGPEFAPIVAKEKGIDEPAEFESAYYQCCVAYGISDIPPWAALALVGFGYTGKRWNAPQFKAKRGRWWDRLKAWYFRKEIAAQKQAEMERAKTVHGVNRDIPPDPSPAEVPLRFGDNGSFGR